MNRKREALVLLVLLGVSAGAFAADQAALTAEAKAAVKQLAGALKSELQAAMKDGGPVKAIGVCNLRAPELTAAVSAQHGMTLTRVSLKHRNPVMGKPNAWQTAVLEDFEARKAAGEDPANLSFAAIENNEFRFMKAIPTGQVCLACHGSDLDPAVAAQLNKLYPDDKATGFQVGDLRGAFVVTRPSSK